MVNKFVKFDELKLEFCKSYGRDMLKIGKIYIIAIDGKVTSLKEFEKESIDKHFYGKKIGIGQSVLDKKIFLRFGTF